MCWTVREAASTRGPNAGPPSLTAEVRGFFHPGPPVGWSHQGHAQSAHRTCARPHPTRSSDHGSKAPSGQYDGMDDTTTGGSAEARAARHTTAGYLPATAEDSVTGNRRWWDEAAPAYLAEHGRVLGDDRFVWGPEGLDEEKACLLGDVRGLDVLEVGAGAAQCSRWLASRGARVVASDLSGGMLAQARALQTRLGSPQPAGLVQADARRLP